jgi:hypothetical protein
VPEVASAENRTSNKTAHIANPRCKLNPLCLTGFDAIYMVYKKISARDRRGDRLQPVFPLIL